MLTEPLRRVVPKKIYGTAPKFSGGNPEGRKISFTKYDMQVDGKSSFGVSGEMHDCRASFAGGRSLRAWPVSGETAATLGMQQKQGGAERCAPPFPL